MFSGSDRARGNIRVFVFVLFLIFIILPDHAARKSGPEEKARNGFLRCNQRSFGRGDRHHQRKNCLDRSFFGGFAQDQFSRHISDPILAAYVRDPPQKQFRSDPSHALCMNVYGRKGGGMEA